MLKAHAMAPRYKEPDSLGLFIQNAIAALRCWSIKQTKVVFRVRALYKPL